MSQKLLLFRKSGPLRRHALEPLHTGTKVYCSRIGTGFAEMSSWTAVKWNIGMTFWDRATYGNSCVL